MLCPQLSLTWLSAQRAIPSPAAALGPHQAKEMLFEPSTALAWTMIHVPQVLTAAEEGKTNAVSKTALAIVPR